MRVEAKIFDPLCQLAARLVARTKAPDPFDPDLSVKEVGRLTSFEQIINGVAQDLKEQDGLDPKYLDPKKYKRVVLEEARRVWRISELQ